MQDQYTVMLALQDYMTVIFSAIGLIILTRMMMQMDRSIGRMATIGAILIVLGGLLKASGKLIISATGTEIGWMYHGLFPMIAPGFTIFGWSLYQVRRMLREQPPLKRPWMVPAIVIGLFAVFSVVIGQAGGPWRVPLILLASIGNIGMLVMLMLAAWGRKMWTTGALFLTTMLVVLLMSQMANMTFNTIAMVWFEQISQSIAQALFALGAWQYSQAIETTYIRRMVVSPAGF
ncbi:hypothetical protein [Candidatus Chloroploca sp. Khr17]|uniref:hypothetical protein n=1 Tax=Candidatus Chloroploca sp. Khr17 TaxID=2496869 RepID=UPI00101C3E96|nr:hypothetical protein [Candidatus Chloroploca sp. Khr17]